MDPYPALPAPRRLHARNLGRRRGPKPPLKLREIWAIRIRLQLEGNTRGLALFNLAIDSKLRGCDLVRLMVRDVAPNGRVIRRTAIIQQKTGQPVSFELTEPTRDTVQSWIDQAALGPGECLFPSRLHASEHLSTRQYARIGKDWVASIGLDPAEYGTHSLRRTKTTLIDRRTKNLRAIQLLLGHTKLESTVRYLGVEVDDALEISEKTEIRRWQSTGCIRVINRLAIPGHNQTSKVYRLSCSNLVSRLPRRGFNAGPPLATRLP